MEEGESREVFFRVERGSRVSFFSSFFFFVRLLQAPFPLSLYFLSLGLLSLHTSSRNAALMACMRSTGTLATLAHCFLICLFFWEEKSGERERVVSDGGSFFSSTSCRVFGFFASTPPPNSFRSTAKFSIPGRSNGAFERSQSFREATERINEPQRGKAAGFLESLFQVSSIDGAPSR